MEPLRALIEAVEDAGYVLDGEVFRHALELYDRCRDDPRQLQALRRMAPEYGAQEFLLPVDAGGRPTAAPMQLLAEARNAAGARSGLADWFSEAPLTDGSGVALLAVRWLCHLVGLRHRTVHLFIDHPCLRDHTLVQVRGPRKAEAPGCFDLPVAGHVEGTATAEEALHRELAEELGLSLDALCELRGLGSHEQRWLPDGPGFRNAEWHAVYRARLTPEGWLGAEVSNREVAALAAFYLPDLQEMMVCFPDRFASGLKGSLSLYVGDADDGGGQHRGG